MSARRLPPSSKASAAKKQPAKNTTADIKMCFFDVKGSNTVASKLDDESLNKLTEAAQSALSKAAKRGSNMYGFVVINPSKIFGQDEAAELANSLTSSNGARIVSSAASTLVVESVEGYTVTIAIVGGAQFAPVKVNKKFNNNDDDDNDNYQSDSSSSFEDASNQQMTQECNLRRYKS